MSLNDPRAAAARSIRAVSAGESLERALDAYRDHPEQALIFELCYGVLRHWFSLSDGSIRNYESHSAKKI